MGFWATNYQIGGVLASGLAAWVLARWGIQWSFWAGSIILLGVWILFLFNQHVEAAKIAMNKFFT